MKKIRVYQLAKELGEAPKAFEATVRAAGIEIKNYMSTLDEEQAQRVRQLVGQPKKVSAAPTAPKRRSVIRRRGTGRPRPSAEAAQATESSKPDDESNATPQPRPAAPVASAKPSELAKTQPPLTEETQPCHDADVEDDDKMIRNDDGVIVGMKRRSEPKILGYIPVSTTRRRRARIETRDADEEAPTGRASRHKAREDRHREAQRRRYRARNARRRHGSSGAPNVNTEPMREEKRLIRVDGTIAVSDLAHEMSEKASAILKRLWRLGLRNVTVNHAIDAETATLVAEEFGFQIEDVGFKEDDLVPDTMEGGQPRAPIVTVMGHVDHGKTSLLDHIRNARVAHGEAGGITQHVGAYRVETKKGNVVFLDTPGHEAFSAMRRRGADLTDIVVLIVAADDGIMPTTVEAIEHARKADVPIVVAINKCDLEDANPGRVKQQLMEHQLVGEEFGGDTIVCEISATTGDGVPALLESIALQAEVMELKAPRDGAAVGVVVESRIDKGRGPAATVIVHGGVLRKGDIVVAGELWGKVRAIVDSRGHRLEEAGPAMPVRVFGLGGVASAGESLVAVDSEKVAKQVVDHRLDRARRTVSKDNVVSIQDFLQRRQIRVLPVILKGDVHGSVEALEQAIAELSTERVRVEVPNTGVGPVSESDVKLAKASDAIIVGFGVKVGPRASTTAAAEGVDISTYDVIYEALDEVRDRMVSLLDPEYREATLGTAEVRATFKIPKVGMVAGCRVVDGTVTRNSHVRVVRDGETIHDGKLGSLRVHADDVAKVGEGRECGLSVHNFDDIREGDKLEVYDLEEVVPSLG